MNNPEIFPLNPEAIAEIDNLDRTHPGLLHLALSLYPKNSLPPPEKRFSDAGIAYDYACRVASIAALAAGLVFRPRDAQENVDLGFYRMNHINNEVCYEIEVPQKPTESDKNDDPVVVTICERPVTMTDGGDSVVRQFEFLRSGTVRLRDRRTTAVGVEKRVYDSAPHGDLVILDQIVQATYQRAFPTRCFLFEEIGEELDYLDER